jgi:hypothetical protein
MLLSLYCSSRAQHSTNSPYSMMGLGEINTETYGHLSGMANSGVGFRMPGLLNFSNPAAPAVDSLSFLFDIAMSGNIAQYSNADVKEYATNFNVRKVAVGVRLYPRLTAAAGILPFSSVQYRVSTENYIEGSSDKQYVFYEGSGGLSRLFLNVSYKLTANLSAGVSASYLFGRINRKESITTQSVTNATEVDKFLAEFGLMYVKNIADGTTLSAGATYSYRNKIAMKQYHSNTISGQTNTKTTAYTWLPQTFGAGAALQNMAKRSYRSLSVDYRFGNWSAITSPDSRMRYVNNHRISAGAAYVPNYRTPRTYFQRVQYQAGVYYAASNMIIGGNTLTEKGITAGLVFPLKNSQTQLFLSADAGRKSGDMLIGENYVKVNFGVSINQQWFMKWFYD